MDRAKFWSRKYEGNIDRLVAICYRYVGERQTAEDLAMFMTQVPGVGINIPDAALEEFADDVKLQNEKEALGFYLTSHPLQPFTQQIQRLRGMTLESLQEAGGGAEVHSAVLVTSVREVLTKARGQRMAFAQLEDRFIRYPAIALEQSHEVIVSMAKCAKDSLMEAIALIGAFSQEGFDRVDEMENLVDHYEDALGSYLLRISPTELTTQQNENLHKYLHSITDFERISDHAKNISECAKEKADKEIDFSASASHELSVLSAAIIEIMTITIRAFVEDDANLALKVEPLEELIDDLCDELRSHHIDRLQKGICTLQDGYVFNDLLTNYERVGDHCSNVAVAMIELSHDVFDTHEYLDSLKEMRNDAFNRNYEEYRARFAL